MNLINRLKSSRDSVLSSITFILFTVWISTHSGKHNFLSLLDGAHAIIYSTLATVDGALLGFMITASSVILGYISHDKFTEFKKDVHYKTFWHTITTSIWLLGFNTCFSILALIFDRNLHPEIYIADIAFGITLLTIWRLVRAMKLMKSLLDIEIIQGH